MVAAFRTIFAVNAHAAGQVRVHAMTARSGQSQWSYGDQIVLRYRKDGRISGVVPVTVVEDSPELMAVFTAVGMPTKNRVRLDGTPLPRGANYAQRIGLPWRLADGVWREFATLQLVRPGASHAIAAMWRGGDWAFAGWYINLQEPLRRTTVGFDSVDHVLDIVVAPDLTWSWKDEDEFAIAQQVDRFTPEEATAVRAEAAVAIAAIDAGAWPYDADWETWRPDPAWPVPGLPDGWDLVKK